MKKYFSFLFCFFLSFNFINAQTWRYMNPVTKDGDSLNRMWNVEILNDTVYVGTKFGVWMSPSGNGGDWVRYGKGLDSVRIYNMKIRKNVSAVLVGDVVCYCLHLYLLDNDGNWVDQGLTQLSSLEVQDSTGYIFTSRDPGINALPGDTGGIYRSVNNGLTWELYDSVSALENLTGPAGPIGIHISKRIWGINSFGNLLIGYGKNSIHISEDNGENWYYRWGDLIVDHNVGSNMRMVFYYNYKGTNYLFTSTDGSVWNGSAPTLSRSSNFGVNFPVHNAPSGGVIKGLPYSDIFYIYMSAHENKSLFYINYTNQLYVSNDNGLNWRTFTTGFRDEAYTFLYKKNSRLYVTEYFTGLWYVDLTEKPSWVGTLDVTGITGSTVNLSIESSQKGYAYYVVLPKDEQAPNDSQVIEGLDFNNNVASINNKFLLTGTRKTVLVNNLLSLKDYKIYVVVTNDIGNNAEMRVDSFKTIGPIVSVKKQGSGTVSPDSGYYYGNTLFTAVADSGWRFDHWTINNNSFLYSDSMVIDVNANILAIATFIKQVPFKTEGSSHGTLIPACDSIVDLGSLFSIRAFPQDGYRVWKWIINADTLLSSAEYRNLEMKDTYNDVKVLFTQKEKPVYGLCDSLTTVPDIERTDEAWEMGFTNRLNEMFSSRVPLYDDNQTYLGSTSGKEYWSEKLAKLKYFPGNDSQYIKAIGNAINYHAPGAGSFWYPFSAPGYSLYYFLYKDSIAKYDLAQLDSIHNTFYKQDEWKYLMRKDHFLDMVYPTGKEFNSENFQWMLRTTGHLFAHEFQGKKGVDNRNLSFTDADSIFRDKVDVVEYFDGFVNNLTRSLYSSGRVEWNSNNYWAHTFNALISLYEGADKCNNPDGSSMKNKAKACMDWMMLEAALHYLDGYQVAADSRAKSGYVNSSPGTMETYTYAFFASDSSTPSYSSTYWQDYNPGSSTAGFLLNTTYRPPRIILDIARKNIPLPVEIQSAKPFYHIDFGDYWNSGETPYQDWRGNTPRSRKFEFETMYIDESFIMSSIAGGRPDGSQGTYSEQAQWEIGVKSNYNGAKQITGNAANYYAAPAGRCPFHEIGQFRNMMLHLVKSPVNNVFYVLIPDTADLIQNNGNGGFYSWDSLNLYINLGNNVFMACKSIRAVSVTVNNNPTIGSNHSMIQWHFPNDSLGGVLIEMGTGKEYADFDNFMNLQKDLLPLMKDSVRVEYQSPGKNKLAMEYVAPGTFTMVDGTFDTPVPNPIQQAASYPKVWGNNQLIDYNSWNAYKTVFGKNIVSQQWGNCRLDLSNGKEHATIKADSLTAEITYLTNKNFPPRKADFVYYQPDSLADNSVIDPAFAIEKMEWDFNRDGIYDTIAFGVSKKYDSTGYKTINIRVSTTECYYDAEKKFYYSIPVDTSAVPDTTSPSDNDTSHINLVSQWNTITLYPNPTNNLLHISLPEGMNDFIYYSVEDRVNRIILQGKMEHARNTTIDVSMLHSGIYLLKIYSADDRMVGRVFVKVP